MSYSMIMWFMVGKNSFRYLLGQSFSCLISQIITYTGEAEWVMGGSCFLLNTVEVILCPFNYACCALLISSCAKQF